MRKIIVSIHSSFNGVVGGPPTDETNFMVWAQAGIKDTAEALLKTLGTVSTILLGRGTQEDLSRKWPFAKDWADVDDVSLRIAEKVNSTPKVVAVGKNKIAGLKWGEFDPPTQLTGSRSDIEKQIKALKEGHGGDIITFGSPALVQSLTNARLVDEYHVIVHPVIVNEGARLFNDLAGRTDFRLISADTFEHGVIIVKYGTVKA
jgi:dihydrofolate reductase